LLEADVHFYRAVEFNVYQKRKQFNKKWKGKLTVTTGKWEYLEGEGSVNIYMFKDIVAGQLNIKW
jgi:hypothetical protein